MPIIITNNPRVRDEYDCIFVEGSFRDVLLKTRDMVHIGHSLISHPLFASLGMMFSPYRTLLVGEKEKTPNPIYAEIIGHAIEEYDKATMRRKPQEKNADDYSKVDYELFQAALLEHKTLSANINGGDSFEA